MESPPTLIDAGAALLGDDLALIENARVVVRGDAIAAAGSRSEIGAPPGATIHDVGDLLLVPGFIDAHVHIGFARPADVLARGVTTVRDLGWPPDLLWPLAEESTRPDFDGPLVIGAGQMLTVEGGYPTRAEWAPANTGRPVTDPADAAVAVEEQIAAGAVVIKIALNPPVGPVLDDASLTAVVDSSHRRHLKVTGHIHGIDQLARALDAGIDELAHMVMGDEVIPDEILDRMVNSDVTVVPTLSIRFDDQPVAIENTRRFLRAGGNVVYGTDLGNEGPGPGIDAREVDAMARAGMTSTDIVRAATVDAGSWIDLPAKGAIAAGRDADLVAVPRAALADPARLTDVRSVWRAGRAAGHV